MAKQPKLPVFNTAIPFLGLISERGFKPGSMIRINGQMIHGGDTFVINLQTGPAVKPRDDAPLHISVRPKDSVIVRNHWADKEWGIEERYGKCPINLGDKFEILILNELSEFKIAVNGVHYCTFDHRLSSNNIKFIHVSGDCKIIAIKLEDDNLIVNSKSFYRQPSYPR